VSDPTGVLATPLKVIKAPDTRPGQGKLLALIAELAVSVVVVGLPLSLSGEDSDQTRAARRFAGVLEKRLARRELNVVVELWDERFTTRMAQRDGAGGGYPQAAEDSRAAAHLLTGWLDAHPQPEQQ
jgi:putative Holliday junction resolvase